MYIVIEMIFLIVIKGMDMFSLKFKYLIKLFIYVNWYWNDLDKGKDIYVFSC